MIRTIDENMSEKNNIKITICDAKQTFTHYHKFLELAYVLKGRAFHTFNETEKQIISEGDFFIIDYKTNHSYESVDDCDFSIINCLFMPDFVDKSLVYCKSFQTLLRHYLININKGKSDVVMVDRIFFDSDGKVLEILKQMTYEYEEKNIGYLEILRLKLIEIFVITARMQSIVNNEDVVSEIVEKMYKEYHKNITLGMYSKEINYSLPYISKLFKEKTGMNFRDYLKKIRIEEACRLLVNSDEKIQNICESVGYCDVDFFSKVFKENMGITPGAFRKKFGR